MSPPPPIDRAPPQLEVAVRGDFLPWLAATSGSLAVTTYSAGKLAYLAAPAGRLTVGVWRFPRPMGIACREGQLALATREHVWRFTHDRATANQFRLEQKYLIGRLDAHDVALGRAGVCFVNTRFNCLARVSDRANFRRIWQPPFVPRAVRRDACHLNGLGMERGRPARVTAFGMGATARAWRDADRFASGVLWDVPAGRAVVQGLCMPHSPRLSRGRWWFCNSGEGALCVVEGDGPGYQTVAELPGFTRGLCFAAGRAVVGLSRIRRRHILDAPPVRAKFPRLRAGLALVDVRTGEETGRIEFVRGGREVYDVAFVPGVQGFELALDPAAPLGV